MENQEKKLYYQNLSIKITYFEIYFNHWTKFLKQQAIEVPNHTKSGYAKHVVCIKFGKNLQLIQSIAVCHIPLS